MDAFSRLGRKNLTMREVGEMIHAHDIAKDGQISFLEFKKIFETDDKATTLDLRK